jgi:hypothetical protein
MGHMGAVIVHIYHHCTLIHLHLSPSLYTFAFHLHVWELIALGYLVPTTLCACGPWVNFTFWVVLRDKTVKKYYFFSVFSIFTG